MIFLDTLASAAPSPTTKFTSKSEHPSKHRLIHLFITCKSLISHPSYLFPSWLGALAPRHATTLPLPPHRPPGGGDRHRRSPKRAASFADPVDDSGTGSLEKGQTRGRAGKKGQVTLKPVRLRWGPSDVQSRVTWWQAIRACNEQEREAAKNSELVQQKKNEQAQQRAKQPEKQREEQKVRKARKWVEQEVSRQKAEQEQARVEAMRAASIQKHKQKQKNVQQSIQKPQQSVQKSPQQSVQKPVQKPVRKQKSPTPRESSEAKESSEAPSDDSKIPSDFLDDDQLIDLQEEENYEDNQEDPYLYSVKAVLKARLPGGDRWKWANKIGPSTFLKEYMDTDLLAIEVGKGIDRVGIREPLSITAHVKANHSRPKRKSASLFNFELDKWNPRVEPILE